ncbi:auxin response factor 17-like [Cucurbita pepo subsp. pepo]|uniref:auxin response factor 17-like n=1 Tax=Cucurbita pepo subsp. pepo TaxID=3664 RepID=UPI000C9D2D5B|nr:auxin response factor 17-like [Cucurbita pepo subsp. pepo]
MDRQLWQAFAGKSVHIHTVGSEVYYFVQGHVEQATYIPSLSQSVLSNPATKCLVTGTDFHADSLSDEVCIKLNLHPIRPGRDESVVVSRFGRCDDNGGERDKIESFAKILTSSDANNGGGFSVPRCCADSVFPPLNYQADPPVQTLSITDVHGVVWNFRHIYRGTPRRHLLTTGWSKFVNHKKLIAGDSVVFAKNLRGDMFVGIRRASTSITRAISGGDCGRWNSQNGGARCSLEENCSGDGGTKVFSRRNIGKLPAEAVANAAELAAQFKPFELVYYPRAGRSEFVVQVEKVNKSKNYQWYSGTRVKMAMETEYSKMTWYQGTVTSASVPEHGPWMGSPWRMLEVTWDEIDALQSAKYVSPWEVELATPTPPIQPPLHPAKKFRGLPKSGMLNGEAELFSPLMNFVDSTMEQFNPSLLNLNSFPAGMQGARQKLFCESRLFNPCKEMTPLTCDESSMSELNAAKTMQMVSTDLLIGSVQFDTLSSDSQASVLSFATGTAENQNCCNSAKAGVNSIQLFGQVIYMNPPVENGLENGVSTNDGGKNLNQSA